MDKCTFGQYPRQYGQGRDRCNPVAWQTSDAVFEFIWEARLDVACDDTLLSDCGGLPPIWDEPHCRRGVPLLGACQMVRGLVWKGACAK